MSSYTIKFKPEYTSTKACVKSNNNNRYLGPSMQSAAKACGKQYKSQQGTIQIQSAASTDIRPIHNIHKSQ